MMNLAKQKAIFWIIRQQDIGTSDSLIQSELKDAKYPKKIMKELIYLALLYRRIIVVAFFIALAASVSFFLH